MQKVARKILFLSDDFPPQSYGGAGMIAYEEASGLAGKGYEVVVVTTTAKKEEAGESTMGSFRVYRLYSRYNARWRAYVSLNNRQIVGKLDAILKKEQPDIVHAHNIHTHISYKSLAISSRYTKNVFLTAHDAMLVHYGKYLEGKGGSKKVSALRNLFHYKLHYNPFRNYFIRSYLRHVRAVFAVSDALKEVLGGNGVENVEVLHNGISEAMWKDVEETRKAEIISKYNLAGKKVILFAGRISGLKGGEVMKEVFNKIKAQLPDARLLVVGKKVVDDAGEQEEGIIFTSSLPREEMKYVYAVSSVVAVPSLYMDPFPTINLEAMASRKPVVGTCFGGTPEAIIDGENGYIVDPNNIEVLESRLVELLTNESKSKEFGEKGYERFIKHFTIDSHLEKLLVCYNSFSIHNEI